MYVLVPTFYRNRHFKTCFASSGAGYVTTGRTGDFRYFLQGVASFHILNKTCEEEEEKYLFTAIEKYQPFLKSGIAEFSM